MVYLIKINRLSMRLPLRLALHSLILVKHRRAILVLVYLVPNQLEQLVLERLRLSARLHHQLLELQQVSLQVKIPVLHCLIHLLNLQDKHLDSLLVRLLHHHPDLVNLYICIFILLLELNQYIKHLIVYIFIIILFFIYYLNISYKNFN